MGGREIEVTDGARVGSTRGGVEDGALGSGVPEEPAGAAEVEDGGMRVGERGEEIGERETG